MTYVAERPHGTGLTVGDTAALIGVTVRTLHHWDEIGLATPSARTPAGYRLYTDADLQRLSRIIAYRETGLGWTRSAACSMTRPRRSEPPSRRSANG